MHFLSGISVKAGLSTALSIKKKNVLSGNLKICKIGAVIEKIYSLIWRHCVAHLEGAEYF